MRTWPALLLAPLLALAQQSLCLWLTKYACEQQTTLALNVVPAVTLSAIAVLTALAASEWQSSRGRPDRDVGNRPQADTARCRRHHLLAVSGTLIGGFSALVSALMWVTTGMLGPCAA
jgi:hypothetical protein